MKHAHRAADTLAARNHAAARRAARWARTRPLHATGATILASTITWQTLWTNPRALPLLPAAWAWWAWRTPTDPTCDDRSEKGPDGGGGEGMSIKKTKITTTQGVCYATDDPTQPGYTRITWETPWEKAPATAYEQPSN